MSDVNKSSGLPMPESEADWVIDLDKLAEETGTSPALSVAAVPPMERSQRNPLDGMTGTEFFRLASETPTDSSLTQVTQEVVQNLTQSGGSPSERAQSYEELQQQNEQLLDWVSELEESLNQCQTALQFQRQRSQELETIVVQRQKSDSTASLEASFNRTLQESQQQVQKQKILVETLTQQLDNSKDRVAHLEQEYGSLQKRFADQTQRLVQSENECRSLKTRLSRQQRYTLQFKAALERCLEVSVPLPADFDAPEDCKPAASAALPEPVTFFPRSSPVQPWSAPEGTEDTTLEGSWHKVTQWVDPNQSDALSETSEIGEIHEPIPPVTTSLDTAAIDLPVVPPDQGESSVTQAIVDTDTMDLAIDEPSLTPAARTSEPLPLEDLPDFWTDTDDQPEVTSVASSHALPVESSPAEFSPASTSPPEPSSAKSLPPSVSLPSLDALNLDAALQAAVHQAPPVAPGEMEKDSPPSTEPYQLWQTLAKANEEPSLPSEASSPSSTTSSKTTPPKTAPSKVKLITFPSPKASFNVQQSEGQAETDPNSSPVVDRHEATMAAVSAPLPHLDLDLDQEPAASPKDSPSPEIRRSAEQNRKVAVNPLLDTSPSLSLQPSWPSPLVYPLRPPKKRNSLAAIELPRFPRQ